MADEIKTFPKWKYHADLPACIVRSIEDEHALGDGWADTPAAFLVLETLSNNEKVAPIAEPIQTLPPKAKRGRPKKQVIQSMDQM